jgi:hypothetical protein
VKSKPAWRRMTIALVKSECEGLLLIDDVRTCEAMGNSY